MPPLKVTIRPQAKPKTEHGRQLEERMRKAREERRMLREKLDKQLQKADEMEALADKNPRTAKARRLLADIARRDAESAYWRAHRATIGRKRKRNGTSEKLMSK
jgi:hypothetical protein